MLLDHVGAGGSDRSAFDHSRYLNLDQYAQDLVEVCDALELDRVVLVGHSVGGTIAALASLNMPKRCAGLVMIGSSPRFLRDAGYDGGMTEADIMAIYDAVMMDYESWSRQFARQMMGNAQRPMLASAFAQSISRIPQQDVLTVLCSILQTDYRKDMGRVAVPALIVQPSHDPAVPMAVAQFLHDAIRGSSLTTVECEGHFPHLVVPEQIIQRLRDFLAVLH